jgi:hypothetical protein
VYDWRVRCHELPHLETYREQKEEVKTKINDWVSSNAGLRFRILHTPGNVSEEIARLRIGHETGV